ncbi:MAG TPA: A24 family peptidase [Rhizomicrobium sp.]|jgi:leader peptidase (prepilin peptidase)/N-methyltransferase
MPPPDPDYSLPLWVPFLVAAPFIGSFLGVLAARLPEGRPVLLARSECDACHATLGVPDLIPLASWLALRGKCRHCCAPIGFYPLLMELAAMAVVVWAAFATQGWVFAATAVLGWILLALAVADWRFFILPDALNAVLALTGLGAAYVFAREAMLDHVIALVAGFAVFAALAFLYRRFRGFDGLGLGDAKLLGALGAWVSWEGLPSVVLYAAVLGLAVALLGALRGHALSATTRIPFGTFLSLGGWLVWLYGPLLIG